MGALDLVQFPRMVDALKEAVEVTLEPGDMLYFPAMWFHHITTLDDDPLAVSVNVFFEHFESNEYDRKDLYGNKDLPAVTEARLHITEAAKRILAEARTSVRGETLPLEYTEFALRQAIADLESYADEMAATLQSRRT
ncbi:hypothetical protein STCU_10953 [Strigomonas culicis]|nr:hypothetical protein STCU_10953 [Strigomonas culicis]|eukprot:EPY16844.1 hypothetical protein STCU_10953 [Strigomonas culicis]